MPISKRKCEEAKRKLKSYLKRDAECVPTQKKARYWFNVINAAAFKGQVLFSNILIRQLKKDWGRCTQDGDLTEIHIHSGINTRKMFIATIAHEMVHLWQVELNGTMNHSASYLKWKRYFKKHHDIIL